MPGSADFDAVRRSYDAVAAAYDAALGDELSYKPLDRALLGFLAEQAGDGLVADLGCGPGHVAAWLAARGTAAVGIDLSPGMIGLARRERPGPEFRVGDLRQLPAADAEFAAIAAFYSIVHLSPADLPVAFGEMYRVLRPGGPALVAFHIGSDVVHQARWMDHEVDLDFRLHDPAAVSAALAGAGLEAEASLERRPYPREHPTRRAYLLARRPG